MTSPVAPLPEEDARRLERIDIIMSGRTHHVGEVEKTTDFLYRMLAAERRGRENAAAERDEARVEWAKANMRIAALEKAMQEIEDMCPATAEVTRAHQMAQIATEALAASFDKGSGEVKP